jgi:hypothetical protein
MIETAQNPCDPEACERIAAAQEHGKMQDYLTSGRLFAKLDVERTSARNLWRDAASRTGPKVSFALDLSSRHEEPPEPGNT